MVKFNIMAAMEYRASFIMQAVGMMINNAFWIFLWFIYFQKFPMINGWTFTDSVLLFALSSFQFGIVFSLFFGATNIARTIYTGELDYYLVFPKNVLWHLIVSKLRVSAIGDIIFAFILVVCLFPTNLLNVLMFMIIGILSSIILLNFIIIMQSIGFFAINFESAADEMLHILLGMTMYPQSVYHGFLKMITYTVLPAFFIAIIPLDIIKNNSGTALLILLIACIVSSAISILFFNFGLKRYESGNLVGMKE